MFTTPSMSHVTCRLLYITSHLINFMCRMSSVTCHMSYVRKKKLFSKHWPLGLSISRNVCLFVCLSVRVSVCLFTVEVPFNGLFAPTSCSRMSNIFRDSESLGKSNEKKWSNIWTFLFGSGLKSPRKKSFFVVADFALQNMVETTLPDGLETSGQRAYR